MKEEKPTEAPVMITLNQNPPLQQQIQQQQVQVTQSQAQPAQQIVTFVQQQPQIKMKHETQQQQQIMLAMPFQNYQQISGQKTQTMQLQSDQAKQIIKTLNAVTTGELFLRIS